MARQHHARAGAVFFSRWPGRADQYVEELARQPVGVKQLAPRRHAIDLDQEPVAPRRFFLATYSRSEKRFCMVDGDAVLHLFLLKNRGLAKPGRPGLSHRQDFMTTPTGVPILYPKE